MSLPKHDPSLAAFVKTLDPTMYSISGGESSTSSTAKAVKDLREQQEYQWYQDQARETLPCEPCSPKKLYLNPQDPVMTAMVSDLSRIHNNIESSRRKRESEQESNPFVNLLVGAVVGGLIVLMVLKCL